MNKFQIVGLFLVKNEDLYIRWAIENVLSFCDKVIVLDNYSDDETWNIVLKLASQHRKIEKYRIKSASESHDYIEEYDVERSWRYKERGCFGRIWKRADRKIIRKSDRNGMNSNSVWVSKSLLRALDADGNGVLTQQEITGNISYINNNRTEIQKGLGGATARGIDTDGDGKISVKELSRIIDNFFEQD